MNLQLSLKKQWFELTKARIKTEDYREITPYWWKRLVQYTNAYKDNTGKINGMYGYVAPFEEWEMVAPKSFKTNTMTLGYPKKGDTERVLKLEHKGIEIRTGNPEWGAEPNKLYFVIKHGAILC